MLRVGERVGGFQIARTEEKWVVLSFQIAGTEERVGERCMQLG